MSTNPISGSDDDRNVSTTTMRPDMEQDAPSEVQETQIMHDEDEVCHFERSTPSWMKLWEAANSMPNQDLQTVLSRPYQLANITWGSETQWTNLWNVDIIGYLLQIYQINSKLLYYKYFRCKGVKITFRINATNWHYGALVVSHVPADSQAIHRSQPYQCMANDPIILSAASADDVDVIVPWSVPLLWTTLDDHGYASAQNIVQISLDVLFPLSMIGTTLHDAEVVILANFIDPEVQGPKRNELLPLAVKGQSRKLKETEKKSKADDYLGEAMESVNSILNVASKVGEVAMKIGALASVLDKPTTTSAVKIVQQYTGRDMIYGEGLDNALRLSLKPNASVSVEEEYTNIDDGNPSLLGLCKTPGFFGTFTFNESTLFSTLLGTVPLNPIQHYNNGTVYNLPTFLTYYSFPFAYWRGSLRLTFYAYTSSFITARVRFVYFPPGFSAPGSLNGAESGDYYSQVWNITGDTKMDFVVPWLSQTSWRSLQGTNGTIALYLMNAMVTAETTIPGTVNIAGFISAADDYQLSYLGQVIESEKTPVYGAGPALSVKGQSCVWRQAVDEKPIDFVHSPKYFTEGGLCMAEEYQDLITCAKRYSLLQRTTTTAGTLKIPLWDIPTTAAPGDMLTYWTACHVYYRGAIRFKVWAPRNSDGSYCFWSNHVSNQNGLWSGSVTYQSNAIWNRQDNPNTNNTIGEVEAPWFHPMPFACVRGNTYSSYLTDRSTQYTNHVYRTDGTLDATTMTTARAAGDDFRVGYLCAPPIYDTTSLLREDGSPEPSYQGPEKVGYNPGLFYSFMPKNLKETMQPEWYVAHFVEHGINPVSRNIAAGKHLEVTYRFFSPIVLDYFPPHWRYLVRTEFAGGEPFYVTVDALRQFEEDSFEVVGVVITRL